MRAGHERLRVVRRPGAGPAAKGTHEPGRGARGHRLPRRGADARPHVRRVHALDDARRGTPRSWTASPALDLVSHVAPIQLALRLLIPQGSLLLEDEDVQALVGAFDAGRLVHPWVHPDPAVDAMQRDVEALVAARTTTPRADVFGEVRSLAARVRAGRCRPRRSTFPPAPRCRSSKSLGLSERSRRESRWLLSDARLPEPHGLRPAGSLLPPSSSSRRPPATRRGRSKTRPGAWACG